MDHTRHCGQVQLRRAAEWFVSCAAPTMERAVCWPSSLKPDDLMLRDQPAVIEQAKLPWAAVPKRLSIAEIAADRGLIGHATRSLSWG